MTLPGMGGNRVRPEQPKNNETSAESARFVNRSSLEMNDLQSHHDEWLNRGAKSNEISPSVKAKAEAAVNSYNRKIMAIMHHDGYHDS